MTFPSTSSLTSDSIPETNRDWHTLNVQESLKILKSDSDRGLTAEQVTQRQEYYGANELKER